MAKMDFPETNRMHYGCSARELFLHPKNFFYFFISVNIIQFDAKLHECSVDQNSIAKQNHIFEGKTEPTLVLVFLS
jgi:hypothetical protein